MVDYKSVNNGSSLPLNGWLIRLLIYVWIDSRYHQNDLHSSELRHSTFDSDISFAFRFVLKETRWFFYCFPVHCVDYLIINNNTCTHTHTHTHTHTYTYVCVCVCVCACVLCIIKQTRRCFSTVTFHYWTRVCARESQKEKETSLIVIIVNVINKMTLSCSPNCQLNLWPQQCLVCHVREKLYSEVKWPASGVSHSL